MRIISKQKAYQIASQWGSYMTSGDPGACFYGFHVNDGRPQDQEHRHDCLNYLESILEGVKAHPTYVMPKTHRKELKQLERWFLFCPDVTGEYEHK